MFKGEFMVVNINTERAVDVVARILAGFPMLGTDRSYSCLLPPGIFYLRFLII